MAAHCTSPPLLPRVPVHLAEASTSRQGQRHRIRTAFGRNGAHAMSTQVRYGTHPRRHVRLAATWVMLLAATQAACSSSADEPQETEPNGIGGASAEESPKAEAVDGVVGAGGAGSEPGS